MSANSPELLERTCEPRRGASCVLAPGIYRQNPHRAQGGAGSGFLATIDSGVRTDAPGPDRASARRSGSAAENLRSERADGTSGATLTSERSPSSLFPFFFLLPFSFFL